MIILKGILNSTLSNDVIIFTTFTNESIFRVTTNGMAVIKTCFLIEMRTNIFQALRSYKRYNGKKISREIYWEDI